MRLESGKTTLEQRIRDLCSELLSTQEPEIVEGLSEQLRRSIHEHVEDLRRRVDDLSITNHVLKKR